jgi:hypothetical protein
VCDREKKQSDPYQKFLPDLCRILEIQLGRIINLFDAVMLRRAPSWDEQIVVRSQCRKGQFGLDDCINFSGA